MDKYTDYIMIKINYKYINDKLCIVFLVEQLTSILCVDTNINKCH